MFGKNPYINGSEKKQFIVVALDSKSEIPVAGIAAKYFFFSIEVFFCTKRDMVYHLARAVAGCFEERPDLCFRFWLPAAESANGPDQVGTALFS